MDNQNNNYDNKQKEELKSTVSMPSVVNPSPPPPPPPEKQGVDKTESASNNNQQLKQEKTTQVTENQNVPEYESQSPHDVMTTEAPKKSKFPLFIVLLVLVTLVIYGAVGYLYVSNKDIKEPYAEPEVSVISSTPTPTPSFDPNQIQIINGSIYNSLPTGEKKLIVNKDDYPQTGITGFSSVQVSLNNQKLCFESWPPSPKPSLFTSDIDGENLIELSKNKKSCYWLTDNSRIVYTGVASNSKPIDIFLYNFLSETEANLTMDLADQNKTRYYEIVGVSEDKTILNCRYDEIDQVTNEDFEANCEIDLTSGTIGDI